jgi:hypothetical protein
MRCSAVSSALNALGIETLFLVDGEPDCFSFESRQIRFIRCDDSLNEDDDARHVCQVARAHGCDFVFGDSYRITDRWVSLVQAAGFFTCVFDDHDSLRNADMRINYAPGASPISAGGIELTGLEYFPTKTMRRESVRQTPGSLILHAGATGGYEAQQAVYRHFSELARVNDLEVTWVIPNNQSQRFLQQTGIQKNSDAVRLWSAEESLPWGDYDIVAGPASTSLYEAIIEGALPISFVISGSQSDNREQWLAIAHGLHLNLADCNDPDLIQRFFLLAMRHFSALRQALSRHSATLDGKGASRIAQSIFQRGLVSIAPPSAIPIHGQDIRECEFTDSLMFLNARNAQRNRSVSTRGNVITWVEHLEWWLNRAVEKFALVRGGVDIAYFWHRSVLVDSRHYLVGGWFPVTDGPGFDSAVKILDWQLKYCSIRYPEHMWIATIRRSNRSVIALNQWFGFVEAGPDRQRHAESLFPGTDSDFVVLEKAAAL